MRTIPILAIVLATTFALTPAEGIHAGVLAGTGPSLSSGGDGRVYHCNDASLVLYGPVSAEGHWALEIASVRKPVVGCDGLSMGYTGWPSHVANNLVGSPETGFTASGVATRHSTTVRTVAWDLVVGPAGGATEWSLHLQSVSVDDGSVRHSWWNGTAGLVGGYAATPNPR